jgi:hypothetical protein
VNLEKVSSTSFYDFETKFMSVFSPSPMVLSAIADAEKKFATEYSKKISDVVGREIPIVVDWSFYKHPKYVSSRVSQCSGCTVSNRSPNFHQVSFSPQR